MGPEEMRRSLLQNLYTSIITSKCQIILTEHLLGARYFAKNFSYLTSFDNLTGEVPLFPSLLK